MNLAPFNEWAGHEIGHDATARLIYEEDGETMEAFAKSRLLSEVKMEAVATDPGPLLIHECSVEAMKSATPAASGVASTLAFSKSDGDIDSSNIEGEAFLKSSSLLTLTVAPKASLIMP